MFFRFASAILIRSANTLFFMATFPFFVVVVVDDDDDDDDDDEYCSYSRRRLYTSSMSLLLLFNMIIISLIKIVSVLQHNNFPPSSK